MPKKILLVDDDLRYRRGFKQEFNEERGYAVSEATSVEEALEVLRQNPEIRVVVLDLGLENSKGTDLLKALQGNAPRYRIIISTGQEMFLPAEEASQYDVFSYQAKGTGFAVESLTFAIQQAFRDIETEHLEKKAEARSTIQKLINKDEKIETILETICDDIIELTGSYTCHIRLFDRARGGYELSVYKGVPVEVGDYIFTKTKKAGEFFSGMVVEERKPISVNTLPEHPAFIAMKAEALEASGNDAHVVNYFDETQSAFIVPITTGVFDDKVDGIFNINSNKDHHFEEKERNKLIQDFVDLAVTAITKHWLKVRRKEIQEESRNVSEMLFEVSQAFHSESETNTLYEVNSRLRRAGLLKEIYHVVFRKVLHSMNPEVISIFLFNKEENRLENVAESRHDDVDFDVDELKAEGLTGHVFKTGETMRTDQPAAHPKFNPDTAQQFQLRAPSRRLEHYLCSPIKLGKKPIGTIRVVNRLTQATNGLPDSPREILDKGFSPDHEALLELTANLLAVVLQDAGLISKLNEKVVQLEALHKVAGIINSVKLDYPELKQIAEHITDILSTELCIIFLKSERGDQLVWESSHPMDPISGAFFKLGEPHIGLVQHGESP